MYKLVQENAMTTKIVSFFLNNMNKYINEFNHKFITVNFNCSTILHKCYISGKIQANFLFLFERTIGNLSNSILRFNSVWFVRKIYLNPCRLLFIFDIGNRHRH